MQGSMYTASTAIVVGAVLVIQSAGMYIKEH
jgi:hypothetical protein